MKYIKLTGIGKYENRFELAIDALDIKYMQKVNEITVIRLTNDEFNVTQSIDEIIKLIEAHSDTEVKPIDKITEYNNRTKPIDVNLRII